MVATNRYNPFPGIRPFELDEEHLFFGREGQADELLDRLGRTRFLAVVGTSGSGKSSLVRAGLLPSLYSGFLPEASSGWRVAVLRPGGAPMGNLAAALNHPEVFGMESGGDDAVIRAALTESTLRRGSLGLVEVTRQARMEPHENLLVVVDQFEELFRFKDQAKATGKGLQAEDEAAAFVKLLLAAIAQREVPVYVVLTMRSDFLGDCAQFRDLPETLNDSQYLIPRLTREQLQRAIAGPVAVGGAEITPRLVNRILNDTGDNPDQLPVMQHALMRTWHYWVKQNTPDAPLDLAHYEHVGGIAEALSRHADQVYDELPSDRCRQIAETLFRCLTDRGADNRDIRRPTALGEICAVADADLDEVVPIVEAFRAPGRSFLMPPSPVPLEEHTVIDISHESLMRNWVRLRQWVGAEAQSAQIYRRLAETAALHKQGKADYLRDPELTVGLTWREEQKPNEAWAERYAPEFEEAIAFLVASAEARAREAEEKERARRREVNRLRGFLGVFFGLALVSGGAAVYALQQREDAVEQAQIAKEQTEEAEKQATRAERQTELATAREAEANEQRKIAQEQTATAEDEKNNALEQEQLAVAARGAEVEQRQRAEDALTRAEEGEAEARRNADIAEEQTVIARRNEATAQAATTRAEQEAQRAERQALNAEIQSEALTVENLMASDLNFKAWLNALALGREIQARNASEAAASATATGPWIKAAHSAKALSREATSTQAAKPSLKFAASSQPQVNRIRPEMRLQATSVLREIYYYPGYLHRNTLEGHGGSILSVSFSPDGQTVASASEDGSVKLWDTSGRELQTLEGHRGTVYSVSFSPDGQTVASASEDGSVKLWDISGRELQTLEGHHGTVYSVSFSPDGQTVASASEDGNVKLWERSGQELQTLEGHSSGVRSVSFSPDGQTVASASEDGSVKLWDTSGRELQTLEGHRGTVSSVSFSPDGQTVASASTDGSVKLWDTSGRELQTLEGFFTSVYSVSFSPDGQTVASASTDGSVKLWDTSGRELQTLEGHRGTVSSVSFSPDGQTVASAGVDRSVKLWSISGRELQTSKHGDAALGVSFSPDGRTVASTSNDGSVKLWDISGRELQTLEGHSDTVWSVSFSPDEQTIASASADHSVKLWDTSGRELQTLEGHRDTVYSVRFSPDGQMLASTSKDGSVKLWDISGRELQTLEGHSDTVWSVSFSPDGQTIASASNDGSLKLWSISGRELQTSKHGDAVLGVSFSPDGRTVASTSNDGSVKLWDISGRELQTLEGHSDIVWSVSFSPDGQTVASGSFDGNVKLWDTSGRELQTLEGHRGEAWGVSFSPDGQTIASAGEDGTVILWNFDLDDLIDKSCAWLSDYMTYGAATEEEKALCQDEPPKPIVSFWEAGRRLLGLAPTTTQ